VETLVIFSESEHDADCFPVSGESNLEILLPDIPAVESAHFQVEVAESTSRILPHTTEVLARSSPATSALRSTLRLSRAVLKFNVLFS
jgi:hypothetical protein